jgi:thiazole synthase
MSSTSVSVLDRNIDVGGQFVNGLWHCFGVRREIVGYRQACDMLDASQTALLPINTNQGVPLIGHGNVHWTNFQYEAAKRELVPCLNINLQTSAATAIRQAVRFRESTGISLLKLEVLGHDDDSVSDDHACVEATQVLSEDGFTVMPLISDNPAAAAALCDIPRVPLIRVMGSPIGSGAGIVNPDNVEMICDDSPLPVILDGGIGTVSHARHALKLGCAGFLVNSCLFQGDLSPVEWLDQYRQAFA